MIIFAYIFISLLVLSVLFFVVGIFVEKNFDESHPVKKWWRNNIVSPYPYDDDIP